MKDLTGLIKKSISEIENKQNTNSEKSLSDKLFDIADKVVDSFNNDSDSKKRKINSKKVKVKNITFSLSVEAEEILDKQLERYMKNTGKVAYKSHILIAAINLLSKLNDEEFVEVVSELQYATMGRPSLI